MCCCIATIIKIKGRRCPEEICRRGGLAKLPHILLLQGAIRIKVGAEAIGAIGVGGAPGGDLDEGCAKAGLDKISGRLK